MIRSGDLLVHHPYESFDDSVEHSVKAAADDARTVAIKMTVYRVGDDTPFVRSSIQASESCVRGVFSIHLQGRGQCLSGPIFLRELVYALM